MKSIGVTRRVDTLGRVVIPKELRKTHGLEIGTPIEIFLDEDLIILRKYQINNACAVTGEILPENKEYTPGVFLSPNGAKILIDRINNENE